MIDLKSTLSGYGQTEAFVDFVRWHQLSLSKYSSRPVLSRHCLVRC